MKPENESGLINFDGKLVCYQSPDLSWKIDISEIKIIAEYTTANGPYIDDYFIVFLTKRESGWHEASFYAENMSKALEQIGHRLATNLECGLCHSTEYKTRILWPEYVRGEDFMTIVPPKGFIKKVSYAINSPQDITLSSATFRVFDKAETSP